MTRKRTVFGRRRLEMDGAVYLIEMRKSTLVIRELYSRRERAITLQELIDASLGQMKLRLS